MKKDALDILWHAGLVVAPVGIVGPFANGVFVVKPKRTPGNTRPGCETTLLCPGDEWPGLDERYWSEIVDAPRGTIYPKDGAWIFEVWEYYPGPGPGDVQWRFESEAEVAQAALRYFFGDPTIMNPSEL